MFARIVKCIPRLQKKEEFLKKWPPTLRTRRATAINGMTHDQATLEWARGLVFISFLVLVVLVISIAGR
jgi:hypothetical protein